MTHHTLDMSRSGWAAGPAIPGSTSATCLRAFAGASSSCCTTRCAERTACCVFLCRCSRPAVSCLSHQIVAAAVSCLSLQIVAAAQALSTSAKAPRCALGRRCCFGTDMVRCRYAASPGHLAGPCSQQEEEVPWSLSGAVTTAGERSKRG